MKMLYYKITISQEEVEDHERRTWFKRLSKERDIFQYIVPSDQVDIKKVRQVIMEEPGK